jgi:hypothetical protein
MSTLSRAFTTPRSSSSIGSVSERLRIRSSPVRVSRLNLRMETWGPSTASGGITALTREPSGSRASTIGEESSMRRPTAETMRSMIWRRCRSSLKRTSVSRMRPPFSMKTCRQVLTRMSETSGSLSSGSSGPSPKISSSTCSTSSSRSS